MLGVFIIAIIATLFIIESSRRGIVDTLISPIWVFTLFYVLSYPLRYYLIIEYEIEIIAGTKPTNDLLLLSLCLSFVAWVFMFTIYKFFEIKRIRIEKEYTGLNSKKFINNSHIFYPLIFFVLISAYLFYQDLVQNDFLLSKLLPGQEHHIARFGNGPYYFLYGFYLNVFLIWLFLFKGFHSAKKTVIFLSLCLLVAFLESTLFGTRRPLYLVLMAFLTAAILKPNLLIFGKRFYKKLLFLLILSPVLLAPMTIVLKYNFMEALKSGVFFSDSLRDVATHISSTFEGVEHLANYLGQITEFQFLFGVGYGSAFLFNIGLAYVPRVIWSSKPSIYGITETQAFLYPEMYVSSVSQTTIPPGLFVDFLYHFGFFSFLILLLLLAILLNWINKNLFVRTIHSSGFSLLVSAFLYINMFNIVRAGTAMMKSVLLLILFAFIFYLLNKINWRIK